MTDQKYTINEIEATMLEYIEEHLQSGRAVPVDNGLPLTRNGYFALFNPVFTEARAVYRIAQGLALIRNKSTVEETDIWDAAIIRTKGLSRVLDLSS